MDPEKARKVIEVLEGLEDQISRRIPIAADRSPDTLMEEVEALGIVMDLKSKPEAG